MNESEIVAPDVQIEQTYVLKLYVAGDEVNSQLARENLKSILDKYLKDRYQLVEVDVLKDFTSALKDKVFVTPALVLERPEPRVMIVGNLGDRQKVVSILRLGIRYGT